MSNLEIHNSKINIPALMKAIAGYKFRLSNSEAMALFKITGRFLNENGQCFSSGLSEISLYMSVYELHSKLKNRLQKPMKSFHFTITLNVNQCFTLEQLGYEKFVHEMIYENNVLLRINMRIDQYYS